VIVITKCTSFFEMSASYKFINNDTNLRCAKETNFNNKQTEAGNVQCSRNRSVSYATAYFNSSIKNWVGRNSRSGWASYRCL